MTPAGALLSVLFLLALVLLLWTTVVAVLRGGLGPADPPASHPRTDPGGFPLPPAPRGILQSRGASTRLRV